MESFQESTDLTSAGSDTGLESELAVEGPGLDHAGPECGTDSLNMVRHALYYQETVVLCVENILFKVPQSLINPKILGDIPPSGSAENDPILVVPNISADSFRTFLKVACPDFATRVVDIVSQEWVSVLKLSSIWGFEDIKRDAVSKIPQPSLADRVMLGRECGIAAWLTEAFEAFVKKWEPIDTPMQELLGSSIYARLVDMRESLWRASAEEISAYAPVASVYASGSRSGRTLSAVAPCYGLDKAKEFRTDCDAVSQNIMDLVTEQVQEFYLAKMSFSMPGIVASRAIDSDSILYPTDDLFYDPMGIFLTGHTLFRLPLHGFLGAQIGCPSPYLQHVNLVKLPEDIGSEDFSVFLRFLYPSINSSVHQNSELGAKQLEEALHLGNLWSLDAVRARVDDAYQKAEITPWETLRMGRRFHNTEWMAEGYAYLVYASKPPSSSDGEAMGWNTYYDVLQLRERRRLEIACNRWQCRVTILALRREWPILLKDIHDIFESDFSRAEEARASMQPDDGEMNDMSSSSSPVVIREDGEACEISRDETFYCPDYVIFLAEKTLFRIPPLRLTTPHLTALFSLPDGGTSQVEGRTDDDPIRLPSQISARAFRAFMNMLYPELIQSDTKLETADLILALELATMWEFDHIRDQAITELGPQPLGPLEQLLLGRRLRVAKWIRDAYERLCTQEELPPKDAGEKIGWHAYGQVASLRERVYDTVIGVNLNSIRAQVEEEFSQELMIDETYRAGSPGSDIELSGVPTPNV